MQKRLKIFRQLLCFIFFIAPLFLLSQNSLEVFGKNKIQYNDDLFDWWIYETKDFVVYWYGKSKPAAQFCIEIAETENNLVQKLFEYHLKDKIELVIYSDPSDLAQTNINLDGLINENTWYLEPKIKDQKILLYFDGDHEHLRNLFRSGITQMYFNSMFSGTALQDVVQKVISLRLPDWFEKGLIQYLSNGWKLEDQIYFNKIWNQKSFKKTANKYPAIAGQSFWNYLIATFGEQAISNWLYMTRIQKDIESAARLVFSLTFQELQTEWFNFYNNQANHNMNIAKTDNSKILLNLKPEEKITSITESSLNNNTVFTSQQNGKARVRIYNHDKNLLKCIFKKGSRSKLHKTDFNYPIYTEDSISHTAFIIYEKRNRVYLNIYDENYKLLNIQVLPEEIQDVYSAAAFSKNEIIFSANTNGYTDIIDYHIKSRQFKKITDDIWDDLDIKLIPTQNSKKFTFRSNRNGLQSKLTKIDTILPLGRFALYSFELDQKLNKVNEKLELEIPGRSINNWSVFHQDEIIKIEEMNQTKWLLHQNDSLYEILENFEPEIISKEIIRNHFNFIFNDQKKTFLITTRIDKSFQNYNAYKPLNSTLEDSSIISKANPIEDTSYFQSQFGNPKNIMELLAEFDKKTFKRGQSKFNTFSKYLKYDYPKISEFNSNLSIAYRNRFWIEELSPTFNNDLLFSGLNTFSGTSKDYEPPPFGILLKTKVTEIFENYSIEGGIRVPTTFDGMEAYLMYEDRKKRFDHSYAAYFKTNTETVSSTSTSNIKKQANVFLLNYQIKYPIDHYRSIKAINTIRNDHTFYLSTNSATLYDSLDNYQQRIGTRLEYVFDNVLDISLNIKNGWQFKYFFEISKRFALNPKYESKFYPGVLMITGFDARLHIPVLTKSVFANRSFMNISFGHDRILYNVGGTENWIIPKFENQSALETSGEYVYSALATEVRSYGYGARKAGSVLGLSSELRIPILQYILNENWRNSLLRNFQVLAFVDAAYVWDGFFPDFKQQSNLNYQAENPAVSIDLQYSRSPLIAGTGFGLRTALFGYFVRFDYGWQVQTSGIKDPKASFSLGLDF